MAENVIQAMTVTASLLKHDLDEGQIAAWLEIFCQSGDHPDDVLTLFTRGRLSWTWWPKPHDVLEELRTLRAKRQADQRLITDERAWAVDGSEHIDRWRKQRLAKLTSSIGKKVK